MRIRILDLVNPGPGIEKNRIRIRNTDPRADHHEFLRRRGGGRQAKRTLTNGGTGSDKLAKMLTNGSMKL